LYKPTVVSALGEWRCSRYSIHSDHTTDDTSLRGPGRTKHHCLLCHSWR